ncbi:MAG: hypothetical protein LAT64_07120 [Phycisphaerales bacterium]|nr:FliO/MopB family protein [Planctomycetota bacterium]MCH8508526.1 hypothetical protein [Phycisphaerales bacterium]
MIQTPVSRILSLGVLLVALPAVAQIGPGLGDVPGRDPAPMQAEAQTVSSPSASQEPTRTPLGAPPPDPRPQTPLVNPNAEPRAGGVGFVRTVTALGGVLLLILALSWVFRKASRMSGGLAGSVGAGGRAPAGIVEVLARYPIAARQTLVVLRFDRRVLLCSMSAGTRSSGGRMAVLCELDDPEDVASVLVKARDEAGESIARSFERTLREFDDQPDWDDRSEPVRVRTRPDTHADRQMPATIRQRLEAMRTAAGGGGR